MPKDISRREFARAAALVAGAAVVGFDPRTRSWIPAAQAQGTAFDSIPKLDGALVFDDATRRAIAVDQGLLFHRIPAAVLKPASVQDIVRIVRYANQHALKIACRGDGHSCYGQTQAEAGIVIDMRTLSAIRLNGTASADVQPGAFWSSVGLETIPKGVSPRVFPATCLALTVGGVLNAGGIGNVSHRVGAVVDNVIELDVVTGDGRFVTCSSTREPELFDMVLAGQGQCGIIVRARIPLMPAPSHAVLQELVYTDLDKYLEDHLRIARENRFDSHRGEMRRTDGGQWIYSIEVGQFYSTSEPPELIAAESKLRFARANPAVRMTYQEYQFRYEARNAAAVHDRPTPQLTMWIPASATKECMKEFLSLSPEAAGLARLNGTARFSFYPMSTRRFARPLFKVPAEEQAFTVWLFRSAPVGDPAALAALIESNRAIREKAVAAGAKVYAPYSTVLSSAEWAAHYGPAVWKRFSAAKKKFDPKNVLSPRPAIFTAP
jgi:cytokinin dehydrogenase